MFLGVYQFDGELADLLPAYERLMQTYPADSLDLHICVQREGGDLRTARTACLLTQ